MTRDQEEQTRKDEQVRAMTSHLLPLSTIAATLPVLFGPDGDFPGAPRFRCALWAAGCWAESGPDGVYVQARRVLRDRAVVSDPLIYGVGDRGYTSSQVFIDLRIPSVAARVAGLCARALGAHWAEGWTVRQYENGLALESSGMRPDANGRPTLHFDGWAWYDATPNARSRRPVLGRHTRAEGIRDPVDYPLTFDVLGGHPRASFLASLFVSLAPRIAALGGSNG